MQRTDGGPRVAATDLSNFIQCRHLTLLDLAKTSGVAGLPNEAPPFAKLQVLEERGRQHEQRVLDDLIAVHGADLVRIPARGEASDDERRRLTREALAGDAPVIYQGVLMGDRQFGAPDFLIRAELLDHADTGGGHTVLDAKLARTAKAAAILQTTFYSRLLAEQTGIAPRWMYLQLGDGLPPAKFRVADFDAYERATYRRMREFLDAAEPTYPISDPYPERVEHCEICSWRSVCAARRRADDDLSRVAGATTRQRKALKAAGIATRAGLAGSASDTPVPDLDRNTFERLRLQAEIQVLTDDDENPRWDWRETTDDLSQQRANAQLHHDPDAHRREPLRGVFALPAPDAGDVFFDLEASRFFGGGPEGFGLEYLFGLVPADGGPYAARWAFDRTQEREAFEWFIRLITERRREHPGMHVYHYNHYEPTALGRLADRHGTMAEMLGSLMGRYGTMEQETDSLLRGKVFVDLFPIFRQAIRAGIENYSLKRTEKVAGFVRRQDLGDATEQLIAFERELEEGALAVDDRDAQQIIAAYNEDDCRATLALRDWLEARRTELEGRIGAIIRPPTTAVELDQPGSPIVEQLLTPQSDGLDEARTLLAGLVEYQRREGKPKWWEYFHLRQLDGGGLLDAKGAIAGLEYVGRALDRDGQPRTQGRRPVFEFSFPPQEHGIDVGDKLRDPADFRIETTTDADGVERRHSKDGPPWEIVELDEGAGVLRVARSTPIPETQDMPRALVIGVDDYGKLPSESLEDYAQQVIDRGDLRARPLGQALLQRTPPTVGGVGLPHRAPHVSPSEYAQAIALGMDRGCLPIQGPPGTGKTYTGARIVVALHGRDPEHRFGVTASTHKAIGSFLQELRAVDATGTVKIGQVGKPDQVWPGVDVAFDKPRAGLAALAAGDVTVLGGTAWLWSNPDARVEGGVVETMLIDEAGQFPLAYAVAATGAVSGRLILLGDPQQLAQVTQGSHPPGAGASALGHILGDQPVLADGQGVFLDETRRMHDDITAFISRAFYLGELRGTPDIGLELQTVLGGGAIAGSGIRLGDVDHVGNDSSSTEEAARVAGLVADLLDRDWTDRNGVPRQLEEHDIKIVTPYNAQIRALVHALSAAGITGVDVGTVDRFQGSQAAVVIYSMATSTAEDAPRGMEFLYQLNRLNVAVSRAMALVCVVMSPELVRVDCHTPRQMQLASAHCLLRESAR